MSNTKPRYEVIVETLREFPEVRNIKGIANALEKALEENEKLDLHDRSKP